MRSSFSNLLKLLCIRITWKAGLYADIKAPSCSFWFSNGGRGRRIRISNKLPGGPDAASSRTTLARHWLHLLQKWEGNTCSHFHRLSSFLPTDTQVHVKLLCLSHKTLSSSERDDSGKHIKFIPASGTCTCCSYIMWLSASLHSDFCSNSFYSAFLD